MKTKRKVCMTCNCVTEEPTGCQGNLLPDDHHLFPKLKKNLDGPKFKDNHELETAAT
jgi:hypothetical protein